MRTERKVGYGIGVVFIAISLLVLCLADTNSPMSILDMWEPVDIKRIDAVGITTNEQGEIVRVYETNDVPNYPFLIVRPDFSDTNNVRNVYSAPPDWMLEKKKPVLVVTGQKELDSGTVDFELVLRVSDTNHFFKSKMDRRR